MQHALNGNSSQHSTVSTHKLVSKEFLRAYIAPTQKYLVCIQSQPEMKKRKTDKWETRNLFSFLKGILWVDT